MNVKKNVKKVFAMATGIALMGATMAGAVAYDLGDYPQPFVDKDSGAFNGAVVVGEDAATMDVVGAIDIAASLQAQSTEEVTVEGSSSVSVEGGDEIETPLNTEFVESYDDYDLEGFSEGDVDVNDNSYDFEETMSVNGTVKTSINTSFDDYEDQPYLEFGRDAINYNVEFTDPIPHTAIGTDADDMEISFLGTNLKVTDYDGDDTVTVEASQKRVMEEGDTVDIDGHTVELARVGQESVIVNVDGQSQVVNAGNTETFEDAGDYKVKVEGGSIFYIEGADDNMATLQLGSSITDDFSDGEALEIFGGTDTDSEASWIWTVDNNTDGDLEKLGIRSNMVYDRVVDEDDLKDRERNAFAMGEELSLPNEFATTSFAGWTNSNMGDYVTLEGYYDEMLLVDVDTENRKDVFVLSSDEADMFEIDGNNVDEVYFGEDANDPSNYTFHYEDSDGDIVNASDNPKMEKLGDEVTFDWNNNASNAIITAHFGSENFSINVGNVTDDYFGSFDEDEATDLEYEDSTSGVIDATDDTKMRSTYGVTWDDFEDMADDDEFTVNVPYEEQEALVTVTSKGSTVSSGSEGGSFEEVQPIGIGLGMLDTDAAGSLGDKPMIVVGGPAINTVAMELMDNPTEDQIQETFSEGKAMIKWYDDQMAMLVAGWGAEETHQASQVLVDRNDELEGSEVDVSVVGDVQDAEINPVE